MLVAGVFAVLFAVALIGVILRLARRGINGRVTGPRALAVDRNDPLSSGTYIWTDLHQR